MSGADHASSHRAVRVWLMAVAALVFVVAAVGGATRLTGSGLSIVEWQPVRGALPPLSEAAWQEAFASYQTIPQYKELNQGMTLAEFKVIYWWEWAHRLLGRLIGVAFLVPFLWFLWRGWIARRLRLRLWIIFGLGALQGVVGWWMVASGLTERTSVSHVRLAFHLTLACAIFVLLLWTAQQLRPRPAATSGRGRATAMLLLLLLLLQVYLGALVAGLRAGLIYNTWPLIDGALVPDAARLFFERPWWRNFLDNALTVQFNHRIMAYALVALALWHLVTLRRSDGLNSALLLAAAIVAQAALGILTLLQQAPLPLALVHQAMAVVTLAIATVHAQRIYGEHAWDGASPPVLAQDRR